VTPAVVSRGDEAVDGVRVEDGEQDARVPRVKFHVHAADTGLALWNRKHVVHFRQEDITFVDLQH